MMEIVAVDLGGTNVRFALAEISDGRVTALGEAVTLKTVEYASLTTAWEAFAAGLGRTPPRAAGIAVASPISGDVVKLTNNPWVIRPRSLARELGLDRLTLVNDFGAVGHAVAQLEPAHFRHLSGPDIDLPPEGVISVVGPGTGLGVAHVLRRDGRAFVIECEGGHIDFAPLDALEDQILARLRKRYRRVSVERIVSGPGLANIYEALAMIEGRAVMTGDDTALWTAAIAGDDSLAAAALDRFCLSLGAVAGDIALAQGAKGVVIAGGIGPRIADHLPRTGFAHRFTAKGRFERMMATIPVRLVTHPQPGLFGAAAAFAQENPA
jgi:glucokinase